MVMETVALVTVIVLVTPRATAQIYATELGFQQGTEVVQESEDTEICGGSVLQQNDDGDFENGYAWRFAGVVPPDYGSWAECYDAAFVCGIQFLFTDNGYYSGETMDVYVWDSVNEGNPPPGPDPGNVICLLSDVTPGPIAQWPQISMHDFQVCCETGGRHFAGYWGDWPGLQPGWFTTADEDGPETGCPRTKLAPGIGYPTGWQHPNIVPPFAGAHNLGIREYVGPGDCQATSTERTSWGRIKALF